MRNNDLSFGSTYGMGSGLTADSGHTTTIISLPAPSPINPHGWLGTRTSERIVANAIVEATHEHYRTLLTKAALENTAALSALEAHLYTTAPFGEERYKTIIDAYALSAAMRIARW